MGQRGKVDHELGDSDQKSGYPLIAVQPVSSEFEHEAPAIVPAEMDGEDGTSAGINAK